MATQNKKYLDDQGLSAVAGYVKERLKTVTTMPASAGNGDVLLYAGATSGSYTNGHIYQYNTTTSTWDDISDSSSISISPTPSSSVTESAVVTAVNAALPASENVPSLYGIQNWSNTMEYTIPYSGTISSGATGIGTWQNSFNNPTAADEAGWGWWYDDMFKIPNLGTSDNVEVKLLYDPALSNKKPVINGGYQLDTDTGYLCVKFGAPVSGSSNKLFAKIIITRNNFS